MDPKLCQFVEQNLWRYVDRELSAREVSSISLHLKQCTQCNRRFESYAREASLYRMAYVASPFGEGFADRFQEALADELTEVPELAETRADIFSFSPPARHRRIAVIGSVAAILLVVVLGVWYHQEMESAAPRPRSENHAVVRAAPDSRAGAMRSGSPASAPEEQSHEPEGRPAVAPERAGQNEPAGEWTDENPDGAVGRFLGGLESSVEVSALAAKPGDRVETARKYVCRDATCADGRIELWEGTELRLESPAWSFSILPGSSAGGHFLASLHEGRVRCTVEKRRTADQRFEVVTAGVRISVVGTVFTVEVTHGPDEEVTSVWVHEGKVHVTELVNNRTTPLEAGQHTRIRTPLGGGRALRPGQGMDLPAGVPAGEDR